MLKKVIYRDSNPRILRPRKWIWRFYCLGTLPKKLVCWDTLWQKEKYCAMDRERYRQTKRQREKDKEIETEKQKDTRRDRENLRIISQYCTFRECMDYALCKPSLFPSVLHIIAYSRLLNFICHIELFSDGFFPIDKCKTKVNTEQPVQLPQIFWLS